MQMSSINEPLHKRIFMRVSQRY